MNNFTYQYPVKQYFGKRILDEALKTELPNMGKTVMFAYDGGSLKKIHDKVAYLSLCRVLLFINSF